MHVSARSYLTSGIALFGAGAIALTPITPSSPIPDIAAPAVSTAVVDLTSTANPIALWAQVIAEAADNVAGIGQDWLSDPALILRQIIANQIGNFDTVIKAGQGVVAGLTNYFTPGNPNGFQASVDKIVGLLATGNIQEAFSVASFDFFTNLLLFQLGLPLLSSGLAEIVPNILGNLHAAVSTALNPLTLFPVVGSLLNVFQGPLNALGSTGQEIVDALSAGDVLTALTAVVNIPAALTGAFLNGFTNWEGTPYVGLLFYEPSAGGNFYAGLVSSVLLGLTRTIAAAIAPQTTLATTVVDEVSKVSANAATTVTLDVPGATSEPAGGAVEAGTPEPGDSPVAAPVAEDSTADEETGGEQAPGDVDGAEPTAGEETGTEDTDTEDTETDGDGASEDDEASDSGEESSDGAAGDRPKSKTRESRSAAKDKSDDDPSSSDSASAA